MPEPAPETNDGDDDRVDPPNPPTFGAFDSSIAARDAAHEAKYGPMRTIKKRVSRAKTAARVIFAECGHEATVPLLAERGRCRECRAIKPKRGRPPKTAQTWAKTAAKKYPTKPHTARRARKKK